MEARRESNSVHGRSMGSPRAHLGTSWALARAHRRPSLRACASRGRGSSFRPAAGPWHTVSERQRSSFASGGAQMPELDLAESFDLIQEMVRNETPVSQGMQDLIRWCSARRPHRDWGRLGRIRWEEDVQRLARWLESVLRDEPPAPTVTGLWFGIFNPVVEDSASADLYVAGNPYSGDPDWAVAPAWEAPAARSAALAEIYKLAYDGDEALGNDAEYPLALGVCRPGRADAGRDARSSHPARKHAGPNVRGGVRLRRCDVGLIRFRGHLTKGVYGVRHGRREAAAAT